MSRLKLIIPTVVHHFREFGVSTRDLDSLTRRDLYQGVNCLAAVFRAGNFFAVADGSCGEIRFYDRHATRLKTVRSPLLTTE